MWHMHGACGIVAKVGVAWALEVGRSDRPALSSRVTSCG